MEHERWAYVRDRIDQKKWRKGQDLMNNTLRRFKTLCRQAGVKPYTIHDLRRSCITNWAKALPVHVVKELAGHSDIRTTQEYYLSVQADDVAKAQQAQGEILNGILGATPTDPKLTHSTQKRVFPGCQGGHGNEKSP
jgi:integrase